MSGVIVQMVAQLWSRQATADGLFVLRTLIAMLLALAIALRLDLSTPGSAAVTVSIIALPQVGMVMEKSFYRLLGTLLGAVAALLLVGIFAQHQYSFIAAVALWIGLCTAASEWFRGFAAYGWVLSGYTAYLVGIPAFMDVPHAFDIAVDRVSIVSVGILSAGVVNAALFPTRSAPLLEKRLRQLLHDCTALFDATITRDPVIWQRKQSRLAIDLSELESLRRSSAFESPVSRIRSAGVPSLIEHLTLTLGHLQILHRQLQSLSSPAAEVRHRAQATLARCHKILIAWQSDPARSLRTSQAAADLRALHRETTSPHPTDEPGPGSNAEHQVAVIATRRVLGQTFEEAIAIVNTYATLDKPATQMLQKSAARLRYPSDLGHALLSGLRSSAVVILTCFFWILTEWPDGASAVLFAAVGTALFATFPQPSRAAWQMCTGALIALPALFICYACVLPYADGFEMLALGLTPFIVLGAWQLTRPRRLLQGSSYFLIFLTGLNLNELMRYDLVSMISTSTSLTVGLLVAMVSLAVVRPADLRWRAQRTEQHLVRCLLLLRGNSGLPPWEFHRAVRDWSAQLISLSRDSAARERAQTLAVIVLELGDVLMTLMQNEPELPEPLHTQLERYLDTAIAAAVRGDLKTLRPLEADLRVFYRQVALLSQDVESAQHRDDLASAAGSIRTLGLSLQALFETAGQVAPEESVHAA